jgi:hypothetical protein
MRQHLRELLGALERNGELTLAARVSAALAGTDEDVQVFLVSNDLWVAPDRLQIKQVLVLVVAARRFRPISSVLGRSRFKLDR